MKDLISYTAIADLSPYLREVSAPSETTSQCAAYFGSVISHKQICIDTRGGHSACNVSVIMKLINKSKLFVAF